jgi:hypothetical protein
MFNQLTLEIMCYITPLTYLEATMRLIDCGNLSTELADRPCNGLKLVIGKESHDTAYMQIIPINLETNDYDMLRARTITLRKSGYNKQTLLLDIRDKFLKELPLALNIYVIGLKIDFKQSINWIIVEVDGQGNEVRTITKL